MEKLPTVNIIGFDSTVAGSITLIFGLAMFLLLVIWRIFFANKLVKISRRPLVLSLFGLFFLPMMFQPVVMGIGIWQDLSKETNETVVEKSFNRLCWMANNQEPNPLFCFLHKDFPKIKELIPAGSKIYVEAHSSTMVYLAYFLADNYRLVSDWQAADYYIYYYGTAKYYFTDKGIFLLQGDDRIRVDQRFEKYYFLGDQRMIFKINQL